MNSGVFCSKFENLLSAFLCIHTHTLTHNRYQMFLEIKFELAKKNVWDHVGGVSRSFQKLGEEDRW